MSLFKRIVNGLIDSYDDKRLTEIIDDERENKFMQRLVEISDKIIEENPNHVDEVQKSTTGCWMDQVFGTHECRICDFVDDCHTKLEYDFQAYLESLPEVERLETIAMIERKEEVIRNSQSIKQCKQA